MNKVILGTFVVACTIPLALFARQGADDMMEGGHRSDDHPNMSMSGSSWSEKERPPMGSGAVKPPMGSGSEMEQQWKGIGLAVGQLSPADRTVLVKMIKDYLTSKGIDPAKYAEVRNEIREVKKETRQEIKDTRKQTLDAIKAKREAMRKKIQEMRGGKVSVQDLSITK